MIWMNFFQHEQIMVMWQRGTPLHLALAFVISLAKNQVAWKKKKKSASSRVSRSRYLRQTFLLQSRENWEIKRGESWLSRLKLTLNEAQVATCRAPPFPPNFLNFSTASLSYRHSRYWAWRQRLSVVLLSVALHRRIAEATSLCALANEPLLFLCLECWFF